MWDSLKKGRVKDILSTAAKIRTRYEKVDRGASPKIGPIHASEPKRYQQSQIQSP